jgi:hypothetical protein
MARSPGKNSIHPGKGGASLAMMTIYLVKLPMWAIFL